MNTTTTNIELNQREYFALRTAVRAAINNGDTSIHSALYDVENKLIYGNVFSGKATV